MPAIFLQAFLLISYYITMMRMIALTSNNLIMDTITLPRRLYCPFPPRINKQVARAEQHTLSWVRKFGLIQGEEKIEVTRRQGYAYMVGRMFPDAEIETFCAYNDLNTLLFLVDDYLDQEELTVSGGNSTAAIETFIAGIKSILYNPEIEVTGSEPVLDAFAELWGRMRLMGKPDWVNKYRESIASIFDAAMWQHRNIEAGTWPTVQEFMLRRQYIGAANLATDCVEMIYDLDLPTEIWDTWWMVGMTELCRNTICWANDLFSHSKELSTGEYHNLVSLFSYHQDLSREDAIEEVIRIHDAQVAAFIAIKDTRPAAPPQHEPHVVTYISVLESIMRGNIDWSDQETTRYPHRYLHEIRDQKVQY
ncbi:hypothetical protein WJU16_03020 [Chitinophaga pollutisoli]|uniref:Terpene synthase n=1 Tax=Chitinophaga pollutisoli TaxID=3133966 RepID=A0ABZ2YRQ3_9BACT